MARTPDDVSDVPAAARAAHEAEEPAQPLLLGVQGWVLATIGTGVPVLLGVVKAFALSRGDMQVLMDVVARMNFLSLVLATLLGLLQTGVLPLLVVHYRNALSIHLGEEGAQRRFPRRVAFGIILALSVLSIVTSTVWWVTTAGLSIIFGSLAVRWAVAARRRVTRFERFYEGTLAPMLTPIFILATAGLVSWPPLELIETKDSPTPAWVYVLGVEDTHTSVLYPAGGIARLANDDIVARALCPAEQIDQPYPLVHRSLLRVLLRSKNEHVPSLCREAPAVPAYGWPRRAR